MSAMDGIFHFSPPSSPTRPTTTPQRPALPAGSPAECIDILTKEIFQLTPSRPSESSPKVKPLTKPTNPKSVPRPLEDLELEPINPLANPVIPSPSFLTMQLQLSGMVTPARKDPE